MKKLVNYQVNEEMPVKIWRPTQLQLKMYAEASGDFNPIHLDDDYARSVGLGGVIAHGMLTMAQVGVLLQGWLKGQGNISRYAVRFKGMVRPGERITCSGRVKQKLPNGLVCDLWAKNSKGEEVLEGTGEIIFNP